MAAFQLSKWYLDCVTDFGNASIAYVGDLHWGPVRLQFSSLLRSVGSKVTQQSSLRRPTTPKMNESSVLWSSTQFDLAAEWRTDSTQLQETVFENEIGSIDWHCLMPCGKARVANDMGLGYVEHLSMTIPPWKIPIRQLRWGRFCSASDWVVWIDWQGEFSRQIVYLNGKKVPASAIEDEHITFDDGSSLAMDRSLILRRGPLGTTALSSIPGVKKTLPARLLQVHECKWRSRAKFECPGRSPAEGWAIHEVVSWPK